MNVRPALRLALLAAVLALASAACSDTGDLEARIDDLSREVETQRTANAALEERLATLNEQLTALTDRLAAIENAVVVQSAPAPSAVALALSVRARQLQAPGTDQPPAVCLRRGAGDRKREAPPRGRRPTESRHFPSRRAPMKLACVVHRFGADIAGGSEAHCRAVAGRLAASGDYRTIRRLMTTRPHVFTIQSSDNRSLAVALMGEGSVAGVEIDKADVLTVRASDYGTFTRALPKVALAKRIRVQRLIPADESLESVFSYLVGA